MSFKDRLSKVNFGRFDRSREDEFRVGSGDDELSNLKADLYKDKNDPEYIDAFKMALSSHKDLQTLATDDAFRKHFKEVHGADGEYDKFMEYADKSSKIQQVLDKKSKLMIEKDKQAIENTQKLGDALCSTMEEPGRTFYQSLFNMLMENKMNAAKLRALKDDETGFDLEDDLKKASGNDNVLEDAAEKSGVEIKDEEEANKPSEGTESTEGATSSEDNTDIKCESKDDLYKLGESLGKKVHGDKYSEKIMKDCVKHALKLSDDKVDIAASMIRNWYRGANAETTNFSTELNKFVEPIKENKMKNFSERISALKKNFGLTEAAQPKEDINPEVPQATQEGELPNEQVAEQVAQPLENQEAKPAEEQTTTEAPKPGEKTPENFAAETQTPAETTQPTGTEASTETVPVDAGGTQEPAATVQPTGTEATVVEETAATQTQVVKPVEETQPATPVSFSQEACPKCGKPMGECECAKVVLSFDKDELQELVAEAKEFTKYPEQYGNSAEQSVCFGRWLEGSRLNDFVRDALFFALTSCK